MAEAKLPINSLNWILYVISLVLELIALVIVILQNNSHCVLAYESSRPVMLFLLFHFTIVIPDIVFVIGTVFMPELGKEPMGIMLNFIMGVAGIVCCVFLLVTLKFCGNSAQPMLSVGAIFGIANGCVHLVNAGIGHWLLPVQETYVLRRKATS